MVYHLEKRFPAPMARLLAIPATIVSRLLSREMLAGSRGGIEELTSVNESLEKLCDEFRKKVGGLQAERSAAFIKWRYFENPLLDFRVFTYREGAGEDMCGYIVVCEDDEGNLKIYDIVALTRKCGDRMINEAIKFARKSRLKSVVFPASGSGKWIDRFKSFGFLKPGYHLDLYHAGGGELPLDSWIFLSGDRNI
jgi:hypothetical protein